MRPGDIIATECRVRWWPPWASIPCNGIRLSQRYVLTNPVTGRRGYPKDDAWRITHVGIYLGDDRVFEVTAPMAHWSRLNAFVRGPERWRVLRRQWGDKRPAIDYPDEAIGYMRLAAARLDGSVYDVGDLIDFLLDGLYGHNASRRRFGFSDRLYVCSTGAAYIEEYARRAMAGTLGRHADQGATSNEPWPRAFGLGGGRYVHTEDVTPALYGVHDDYYVVEVGRV